MIIGYDNLVAGKRDGTQEIRIICQGFKNPIYRGQFAFFALNLFDNEPFPNFIASSVPFNFDSSNLEPAIIPSDAISITPTIFKIAEYSVWNFLLSDFPIPLEQECFVEIYIPPDLAFDET